MMHLVLHVGAQGTDEGQIANWLARNRAALEPQGLALPAPGIFLRRISDALEHGRDADPLTREDALLRSLGASGKRLRMVVSAPGLLGGSSDVLASEGFYRRDLARRLYALRTLFPRSRVSVLLGVARAGHVIPVLLPDEPGAAERVMAAIDDETLPWARLAQAIRNQLPDARLIVWRHEDLQIVWPQVLRWLVGPGIALPASGLFDLATIGLGAEARLRLSRYLASNPPANAAQLRDLVDVFARRFGCAAPSDRTEPLPGWLRQRLTDLDHGYATEWADLTALNGVTALPMQDAPAGRVPPAEAPR